MIDDDYDEDNDEERASDDDPDREPDGCCLGADCLNAEPYHLASECFDLEMAQALMGNPDRKMIRSVIIAGSRTVSPTVAEIDAAIAARDPSGLLWAPSEWTEIVCGCADGADRAGAAWADAKLIAVHHDRITPEDYATHGRYIAPKVRNRRMAERADAALIFWDGMSGGSADMCCRMVARSKPVAVFPWRAAK